MAQVERHPLRQRQIIRAQLTSTRAGFHALLDALADNDLRRSSGNPAWTVGAVLTHLVWSLELLPREVASARQRKGMFNMPPLLRDALNAWTTRLGARGQTLNTLRQRYEVAYAAALATLEGIRDDEFELGAHFWSEGFRDVAGLYAAQVDHLVEHADDIRYVLPRFTNLATTSH